MPLDFSARFTINDFDLRIKLTFQTPLRIKKNNVFVRDNALTLRDIFSSIHKCTLTILGKKSEILPQFGANLISINLKYIELYRKSNAQKVDMNLGGLMGEIPIDDLDKQGYELLKIGELIGIGKNALLD